MNHLITITKSDGTTQLFEEEKLVNSLKRAGATIETIDEIVDVVEKEMWDGIKTEEIYHRAFDLLKKKSKKTAVKYSLRRALFELGPDGFPFEKLVARIFNFWGYQSTTGQVLMGTCVEHEVDIVAWKGESDLAMAEAKFHNELGLKSDLKVALYVKARFDDLADNFFDYGGKRKLTERWLFTNTKFSESAIKYAECKDLKMIGWNYPLQGSLHDILEENNLHPITSFSTLSNKEKRDLITNNVIIVADVAKDPSVLEKAGISPDKVKEVVEEAKMICGI